MPSPQSFSDIVFFQNDAETALRLYYSQSNPNYTAIFASYLPSEVSSILAARLDENDMRSALVLMARIEAAFRIDYKERGRQKLPDSVSTAFRKIHKIRGDRARLDEDIWETWREFSGAPERQLISALRGAFRFRHWLAHGRHWSVGQKHDFQDLYILAAAVLANFPLLE